MNYVKERNFEVDAADYSVGDYCGSYRSWSNELHGSVEKRGLRDKPASLVFYLNLKSSKALWVDDDLDLGDAVAVEFGGLEGEVLVVEALVKLGEVALNLEQQACQ